MSATRNVLALSQAGATIRQIAEEMGVSSASIHRHPAFGFPAFVLHF
jgi:hypothetical protein